MPNCGNCKKPVAVSDVTCPHCGVLLAAYASPTGSGAAGTYVEPPPPPTTEIPSVDMEVKPPSEADIVTDPAEVSEEPISTAPRPLFDTYLTVEEIVKAAEGDHLDDVVTISDQDVATKKVEFDVPDYARPPANAAPIPTIDEDDESIPLITRDGAPEQSDSSETSGDDDSGSGAGPAGESWLHARPTPQTNPRPNAAPSPQSNPRPNAAPPTRPASRPGSGSVGETDQYLRKLHHEAGYTTSEASISQPVAQGRISPAERSRNRRPAKTFTPTPSQQQAASQQSTATGASTLYILVLAILWFSTMFSILSGSFNTVLIFVTVAATWGFKPVRKSIEEWRHS